MLYWQLHLYYCINQKYPSTLSSAIYGSANDQDIRANIHEMPKWRNFECLP